MLGLWEFTKHAIGGGLITAYAERRAEDYLRRKDISPDKKNIYAGSVVGAVGGGVLGYYIGEQIGNHRRKYTVTERLMSTAIGSGTGAVGGAMVANYLNAKMADEGRVKHEEGE